MLLQWQPWALLIHQLHQPINVKVKQDTRQGIALGNTHVDVEALAQVPVVLHTPFATAVEIPDVVPQLASDALLPQHIQQAIPPHSIIGLLQVQEERVGTLVTILPAPHQLAKGEDMVICRPARAKSILRLMQQLMLLSSTDEPVGDYLIGQLTNHTQQCDAPVVVGILGVALLVHVDDHTLQELLWCS